MSPKHLGRDAVPSNILDRGTGRHGLNDRHHLPLRNSMRYHHALSKRYLHKRRVARRYVSMFLDLYDNWLTSVGYNCIVDSKTSRPEKNIFGIIYNSRKNLFSKILPKQA